MTLSMLSNLFLHYFVTLHDSTFHGEANSTCMINAVSKTLVPFFIYYSLSGTHYTIPHHTHLVKVQPSCSADPPPPTCPGWGPMPGVGTSWRTCFTPTCTVSTSRCSRHVKLSERCVSNPHSKRIRSISETC